MNYVQIAGHLGADPETRYTPNGQKVTTLRLATNGRKSGKDYTIWWRATIWGENPLLAHVKKGSALIVMGEMAKPEIYMDKEGKPQISMEMTADTIRFSPFGKGEKSNSEANAYSKNSFDSQDSNSYGGYSSFEQSKESMASHSYGEDDVPF